MLALVFLASLAFNQAVSGTAGPQAARPYFNQRLPAAAPEPFAPAAAAALGLTRAPVFSLDGSEMFWARSTGKHRSILMTSRLVDGTWTTAVPLPFSTGAFFDHNPAISRDGRRVVFASNRPIAGKAAATLPGSDVPASDLWVAERATSGWSEPTALGPVVNTDADEDCPVLAADGTLYFSSSRPTPDGSPGSIYRASVRNGGFHEAERLPAPVNQAGEMVSGIAPDGSYLVFYSMKAGGAGGLCVSFRDPGGSWGAPVRLAPALGDLRAYAGSVTQDGRWVLLSTFGPQGTGVYWASTAIIEAARPPGSAGVSRDGGIDGRE
jgi:hypothetical protein